MELIHLESAISKRGHMARCEDIIQADQRKEHMDIHEYLSTGI